MTKGEADFTHHPVADVVGADVSVSVRSENSPIGLNLVEITTSFKV